MNKNLKKNKEKFVSFFKKLGRFIENAKPLKRMTTTDEIVKIILNFIIGELHCLNRQIFKYNFNISSYNHMLLAKIDDDINFSLL